MAVVIGIFGDYARAQTAVRALIAADFSSEAVSVVGRRDGAPETETDTTGTAIGVGTGAVLGGALAAMGLAIPGIGVLLAAGPLAAALAGASVGAAAGSVIGVLVDLGVPDVEAQRYAEALRGGRTLVTVTVDEERSGRAMEILNRHGALDIEEREDVPRARRYGGPSTDGKGTGSAS